MQNSLFDLTGKVAIVTGSTRGVGKAIAYRLAEHGARVAICSRKAEACADVAKELNAIFPGSAIAAPASISSKDDLIRLVTQTREAFGDIDILVCNAATNPFYGSLSKISDDQFRKTLENNILANHWLAQQVAPGMIARKDGSIIIISSIAGMRSSVTTGAYDISKAADFQLARSLAAELGPHNVRVNCIAPGVIKTDFARALWEDPETLKFFEEKSLLGRIGEPDDIAGAAVFLASRAAKFVTGQTLIADGGVTAR